MAYRSAKAGQQVFWQSERSGIKEAVFIKYAKANKGWAVIQLEADGIRFFVEVKDLFKEDPYA